MGCGSGVLAIAAAKLGFEPVVAVDVDPLAVEATRANAVGERRRRSRRGSSTRLREPLPAAATVVANIALGAVEEVAPRSSRASGSSRPATSSSDQPELSGYSRVRRLDDEGWAADLWEAPSK